MGFDISGINYPAHERYAEEERAQEAFRKEFPIFGQKVGMATTSSQPQPSATSLLMQTRQKVLFVRVDPPPLFSALPSSYLVPSLSEAGIGSLMNKMREYTSKLPENQKERNEAEAETLILALEDIRSSHELTTHLRGIMQQLLHI